MNKSNISIIVTLVGKERISASVNLERNEIGMAYEPLDKPDYLGDWFTQSLCTEHEVIEVVEIDRNKLAEKISKNLTHYIMEALESKDTIMGHPIKNEN